MYSLRSHRSSNPSAAQPFAGLQRSRKPRRRLALAVALLSLPLTHLQAATIDLQLSGQLADVHQSSSTSGSSRYETWSLPLAGLDLLNPTLVALGDTINATVLLDQAASIAGSVSSTFFQLTLGGTSFPAINTATIGTTALFEGAAAGPSGGSSCGTFASLASCLVLHPPQNIAFSFDRVQTSFTVNTLGQSALVNRATLVISRVSPVPEPASAALLLAGMCTLVGSHRLRAAKQRGA